MRSEFPPKNYKNLIALLNNLGFIDIGGGKHSYKFIHPLRKPNNILQPNFIIISTSVGPKYVSMVIKQIKLFGFNDEEIKQACRKKIY